MEKKLNKVGYHKTKKLAAPLPDEILKRADEVNGETSKKLGAFAAKHGMRNIDLLNAFQPILSTESQVSKIMNGTQKVPLELCVILHYKYGIDLNEFIAGDENKAESMDLTLEQKDVLVEILERFLK